MKLYIVWEEGSYSEPELFTDPDEVIIYLTNEVDKEVVIYDLKEEDIMRLKER